MDLQDFPPEIHWMIFEELHELHRKDWIQQIKVINTEYKKFWSGTGCNGVRQQMHSYPVHFSGGKDGIRLCEANYRNLSVVQPNAEDRLNRGLAWKYNIWNWNTDSIVGHVPNGY